jgi:hypothetical protein|tara:strand:- start:648 stop:899 length:252 start_codon:yes stop_codon:yes gene_type:complete
MNARKSKQLRKKARQLQVDWINTLLPDGEYVTLETLPEAMPDQKYYMNERTLYLSFMSDKWIEKQLKRNSQVSLKELMYKHGQ